MMLGSTTAAPVAGEPVMLPACAWPLLGYLIVQPNHEARREAVAAALWPDQPDEPARRNLATLIWRVKAAFGDTDSPLEVQNGRLALRCGRRLWIDALALEHRARVATRGSVGAMPASARARVRRSLLALSGDFLPSIDAEWALVERERLRCLRLDALFALASADAARGDWLAVVDAARALCASEPLREDSQRLLMLGYARMGNRALAIRQYTRCAAVLAQDLGIDPMPETQALYQRLTGSGGLLPDQTPQLRPALFAAPAASNEPELRTTLLAARETMVTAIKLIDSAIPPL